jgi:hypothetical protein
MNVRQLPASESFKPLNRHHCQMDSRLEGPDGCALNLYIYFLVTLRYCIDLVLKLRLVELYLHSISSHSVLINPRDVFTVYRLRYCLG